MAATIQADQSVANRPDNSGRQVRRQRTSEDLRCRLLRYLQSSPCSSVSAAARIFNLPVSTAHTILRRIEANGNVTSRVRTTQTRSKITPEALLALSGWVDARPDSTLHDLAIKLVHEHDIIVCKATVSAALTKIGFTVKLTRPIPISRNCPDVLEARKQYAQKFLNEAPPDRRDIVWVDECGFNLHIRRKFGRARRGEHASLPVANSRGRNISACAAMSDDGLLHEIIRPGAYNTEHFCAFLTSLFVILSGMGRSHCWIILDNVRFHHSASVRTCTEQHGHHLVFLPPYSPMLNPIESLFSKWKTLIRTEGVAMNQEMLLRHMATARYEISRIDCLGWIRDISRNIGLSLQDHVFQ